MIPRKRYTPIKDRGTSFPNSPGDGDVFFRTDLLEWFMYLDAKSLWYGPEHMTHFGKQATGVSATYLRGPDAPGGAALGVQIPYAIAVTRFTGNWTNAITLGGFQIRRNGSGIHTWNPSGSTSSFEETVDYVAFAATAALAVFVQNMVATVNNPTCAVFWRRAES